eukprot:SAG11_NODE_6503_length_1301_cov_0.802829_1_plen_77_part_00
MRLARAYYESLIGRATDDLERADAVRDFAEKLGQSGKYTEAVKILRDILKVITASFGERHDQTISLKKKTINLKRR